VKVVRLDPERAARRQAVIVLTRAKFIRTDRRRVVRQVRRAC
jgi:hypothetical protein